VAADLLTVDPDVGEARGLLLDLAVQRPPRPSPTPPGGGPGPAPGGPPARR
jgi:hypothetical protein